MAQWKDFRVIPSKDEHVKKIVFTNDNAVAEAVLYKYPTYQDRTVICLSTQSGCPIGCKFCGTGEFFVRSLTAEEILEQALIALTETMCMWDREINRLQIMFMSMGEPMLNMSELLRAIIALHALVPNAELLVSTSAPDVDYEPFIRASMAIPKIGLQFSVHESTDEARNLLIPFKRKRTLAGIAEIGNRWHAATGRPPFFNYCATSANSSQEDVDRLAALFPPEVWNATVSVVCEKDESVSAATARQLELAQGFSSKLVAAGYNTRVFNPAGQDDIGGGCGQLWFVQQWVKGNSALARKSTGCRQREEA